MTVALQYGLIPTALAVHGENGDEHDLPEVELGHCLHQLPVISCSQTGKMVDPKGSPVVGICNAFDQFLAGAAAFSAKCRQWCDNHRIGVGAFVICLELACFLVVPMGDEGSHLVSDLCMARRRRRWRL